MVDGNRSGRRRQVAVNALYLVLARNIGLVARLVFVVVAAIYLGPADYGLFQAAYAWYLVLLPLAGGGLQFILGREIGRDPEAGRAIVFPSLLIRAGLALLAACLCVLGGWLLQDDVQFRLLLTIFSLALFGRSIAVWANAVFTAHHASRYNLLLELAFRFTEAALAMVVLTGGYGIMALAVVHAACWWLQALMSVGLLLARFRFRARGFDPARIRELAWTGLPLALALFLIAWQTQGPLILFKELSADAEVVGQFALAFQAFLMAATVAWALGNAALPALSAAATSAAERRHFISGVIRAGAIGGTGLALGGWAFGAALVHLVFGDAYADAGEMLGPVLLLFGPLFIGNNVWRVLIAESRDADGLRSALFGALATTAAVVPMTIRFGAAGCIVGAGIGLTVWVASLLLQAARNDAGQVHTAGLGIAPALLSSASSLAVYLALEPLHPLAAFCAASMVLAALGWGFVATDSERRALLRLIQSRR